MNPPLEKDVIKILLDGINSAPKCKAIKIHNAGYIEKGTPDIIASLNGHMVLIEAKRDPTKSPSYLQEKRLEEWSTAGATTAVIKGVAQAKLFIKSIQSVDLEAAIGDTIFQAFHISTQTNEVVN